MTVLYEIVTVPILGYIYIGVLNNEIISLSLSKADWEKVEAKYDVVYSPNEPVLLEAVRQLHEYFEKKRKDFSLPLNLIGTSFQEKVWKELCHIPYGETKSYADIAKSIENEKAVRAVGQANRRNPIPIIVPCHRVIGKNKSLTGYAGSRTDIKEKLLYLEEVNL